ncbi:MAG: glutamate racemase [Candidatus Doudnabacteria bacterium]|nr:glutamate racemase [Candidatus Doudnabacteria bacterium]
MKIGIFDSGLGGLVIAEGILKKLPEYDYIYLGDTKNLPYGEKSPKTIYTHTKRAVGFMFRQNCQIVIIACNTASAWALRKIQQEYLPRVYPKRRVLGVIIPTLEVADHEHKRKIIGVIATAATVKSHIYKKELSKIDPGAKIIELATPKLVPLIETNSLQNAEKSLKLYLEPLQKHGIEALILGCTHYPILKQACRKVTGNNVAVVSQDEIIPNKLAEYLKRHKEITRRLSKNRGREFLVTKQSKNFDDVAKRLFRMKLDLRTVKI